MATLKPTTPLLTPNKGALKPASPLRPKTAPKTPISHPQRRRRFQSRLGRHPQRRQGFHQGSAGARKGDDGFSRGSAGTRKGDGGFRQPAQLAYRARLRYPWAAAGPGRATSGRPTLQTSSNQRDSHRLARIPVTNVVNLSQKTAIFSEKALGLTTFVTTGQKARRKTPWIDDVCNNTHPSTPKTQRTRRDSMATLKPTTPLRANNKGPLKPTSPLHPKTAPKTPISHPQRRWRFHSHTGISEQRRWRFQTTGPAGLQGLAATPARSYKPTPQKTRMQFDWERFQQRLKTLQFQRSEFKT